MRYETKGVVTMTSVVATATPKIVGKALYLELVANPDLPEDTTRTLIGWQHKGTKQILIFPEYQDDTGRIHTSVALTRIVSEHTPRSQWDTTYIRPTKPLDPKALESEDSDRYYDYLNLETYKKEEWDTLPIVARQEAQRQSLELFITSQMKEVGYVGSGDDREAIVEQAWTIRDSKPFAVEITDEDFDDLHRKSKTPQAVVRRINKVRESISSFPNKLA